MDQGDWLEEIGLRQAEISVRYKKTVRDVLRLIKGAIENSDESDDFYLINAIAKALVARLKRKKNIPSRRKDIFDTGIPSKQVDIEITGEQSVLAGDIRVKGRLLQVVDDRYVIIKIPKTNIGGWTIKGGSKCRKKEKAGQ